MEGYDVCGNMTVEDCHNLDRSQRIQSGPERLHRKKRDLKKMNDRLETFVTWPPGMPVEPKILADAGLVYLGCGDKVQCFSCKGGLKDWEKNDDPWLEHAVWYPLCQFVIDEKGEKFISEARKIKFEQEIKFEQDHQMIQRSNSNSDSGYESPESQEIQSETPTLPNSEQSNDENLCIICCDQDRSLVFLPCGHLVSCGRCGIQFTTCPNCRSNITGFVRAQLG